MERWCLCGYCVDAIRSRGERIMTRPMETEDCTEQEYETDTVVCDWCEEDYTLNEMYVCE